MKLKKLLAIGMVGAMTLSMVACGSSDEGTASSEATQADTATGDEETKEGTELNYADITLGQDFTDLDVEISLFNHRTDMDTDTYAGTTWADYLADFNEMYPNIKVNLTTDTNYADDALTHLQSGDYETVMMIPAVDKSDLSNYFISFGDLDTMSSLINYATTWSYDDQVYGVPSTATTQGIVYNKKVFEEAGITDLPTTPEEFISDLQLIKDNTDAIPLYTNYAAGWTMGAWDAYIGGNATGDATYMNQKLVHTQDPFQNYGDDAHAYSVYKILYDAVADGLIEDDYSTTDWESSKTMMNNGEIACMALGSWAFPQMEAAGDNAEDIGYMPFPITIDGKQYAAAGADYSYGISKNASLEEQEAAMVFVKWMTEESGFSYNEDGLPVSTSSTDTKLAFDGVEFLIDEAAFDGEEDYLNEMNSESELNINAGGNTKIQEIVEDASNGSATFDDIMTDWNQKWSDAQSTLGIEVNQ